MVKRTLVQLEMRYADTEPHADAAKIISNYFEDLVKAVDRGDVSRWQFIDGMLPVAYVLARSLWEAEQDGDHYRGADAD